MAPGGGKLGLELAIPHTDQLVEVLRQHNSVHGVVAFGAELEEEGQGQLPLLGVLEDPLGDAATRDEDGVLRLVRD